MGQHCRNRSADILWALPKGSPLFGIPVNEAGAGMMILGAFLWFGMSLGSNDRRKGAKPVEANSDDQALVRRLEKLVEETSVHRDPDLSVGRLARRLGVPVQELSRAVNRGCGMNVSQWINKQRIDEAATMLREIEKSVSEIHKLCGFLSRSNFYREFQRIHSRNPGEFRALHG
jgi:AraC-like DNA-binding protein